MIDSCFLPSLFPSTHLSSFFRYDNKRVHDICYLRPSKGHSVMVNLSMAEFILVNSFFFFLFWDQMTPVVWIITLYVHRICTTLELLAV